MTDYVPGIIVLVGKVAFLVALYGFVLVVFRGLMVEARRAGRPAPRLAPAPPGVRQWELRPPQGQAVVLRPTVPPTLTPPLAGAVPPVPGPPARAADEAEPVPELQPPSAPTLEPAEADAASDAPPPEVQGEEEFAPEIDAQVTSQAEPVPETEAQSEASEAEPCFEPTLELSSPAAPEAEPQPKAVLVVLTSPEANLERGTRLQLPDPARLGRAEDNDIILHDRFVSAHHAEVVSVGDGFVLRDLGSTNGTFCNGVRVIGEVPLREGDRIGIGTSVFAFHGGR